MGQRGVKPQFVVCVQNTGCDDLVLGRVYQVLPDESAAKDSYIRVVDESGEDYLYPADYFVSIALPEAAEGTLLAATSSYLAAA